MCNLRIPGATTGGYRQFAAYGVIQVEVIVGSRIAPTIAPRILIFFLRFPASTRPNIVDLLENYLRFCGFPSLNASHLFICIDFSTITSSLIFNSSVNEVCCCLLLSLRSGIVEQKEHASELENLPPRRNVMRVLDHP